MFTIDEDMRVHRTPRQVSVGGTMEQALQHRERVGVQDFILLEDYRSEHAFIDNLKKRFSENIIYFSKRLDFHYLLKPQREHREAGSSGTQKRGLGAESGSLRRLSRFLLATIGRRAR
ncbi:Unconventional myosin-Ic [Eumeta japonica]|uniref:Unconventional myosin-Ic n=1 Tax=Eumeta variegata TaxID=151549 RepID=A0A4C1U484_EUMVA|nr:Unconventional myosin-Ic [Eumeta japonica]